MRILVCALLWVPLLGVGGCNSAANSGKGDPKGPPQTGDAETPTKETRPNPIPIKDGKVVLSGDNTQILFFGNQPDGKHNGGFSTFTGAIAMNEKGDAPKSLALEIDAASIWADSDMLTDHLKNPDFFDVAQYPKVTFESTKIKPAVKDDWATHTVTGKLTLHGKTKEISFPILVVTANDTLLGNSRFKINRQDFGMTFGPGKANDVVNIGILVGVSGK